MLDLLMIPSDRIRPDFSDAVQALALLQEVGHHGEDMPQIETIFERDQVRCFIPMVLGSAMNCKLVVAQGGGLVEALTDYYQLLVLLSAKGHQPTLGRH